MFPAHLRREVAREHRNHLYLRITSCIPSLTEWWWRCQLQNTWKPLNSISCLTSSSKFDHLSCLRMAIMKGVSPTISRSLGRAPCRNRVIASPTFPFPNARCIGLAPDSDIRLLYTRSVKGSCIAVALSQFHRRRHACSFKRLAILSLAWAVNANGAAFQDSVVHWASFISRTSLRSSHIISTLASLQLQITLLTCLIVWLARKRLVAKSRESVRGSHLSPCTSNSKSLRQVIHKGILISRRPPGTIFHDRRRNLAYLCRIFKPYLSSDTSIPSSTKITTISKVCRTDYSVY